MLRSYKRARAGTEPLLSTPPGIDSQRPLQSATVLTVLSGFLAPLQVCWSLTGLGGHAYSLSISSAAPHMLAVGCGDSTIRALPLPSTAAPIPAAVEPAVASAEGQPDAAAAAGPAEGAATEEAAEGAAEGPAAPGLEGSQMGQPGLPEAPARQQQLPQLHQVLAWQGVPSKVTAVAWHPAEPGVLSLGCHDGSVGLLRVKGGGATPCRVLPVRHKVRGGGSFCGKGLPPGVHSGRARAG